MALRNKTIIIFIVFFLIIGSNISIILASGQSNDKIQKEEYVLDINSLSSANPPIINETIRVEKVFTAYWEYHIIWKDYRDQQHTAIGDFYLIGYNNTLNITFSNIHYVQYGDVYIRNKYNSSSKMFYFSEVDVVVVNNCQDWEYRFTIEYSYTYTGCIDPNPPFCDQSGQKTASGSKNTDFYDFFPQPPEPTIPGYSLLELLSIVIILGVFLTFVIRSRYTKIGNWVE